MDINKEAPPYKKYLSDEDRQSMISHYQTQSNEELASKMKDWTGDEEGGFDEKGLYTITKWNPDGKIDSWQLLGPN